MKATEFVYWLQGLFELSDVKSLNEVQTQIIKNHLKMVFFHDIDPKYGDEQHKQSLHKLHESTGGVSISRTFDGTRINC